jgi:methanethiol S-methyltransferase
VKRFRRTHPVPHCPANHDGSDQSFGRTFELLKKGLHHCWRTVAHSKGVGSAGAACLALMCISHVSPPRRYVRPWAMGSQSARRITGGKGYGRIFHTFSRSPYPFLLRVRLLEQRAVFAPKEEEMNSIVRKAVIAAVMVLAAIFGVGSILLFVLSPHGAEPFVHLPGGPAWALVWDTAVSLVFFLQHSGMIRKPVRARLARLIPGAYFGAVYSISSGVALAMVVIFWQPIGISLFVLHGVARYLMCLMTALCVGGFVWGAVALKGFDMLGLRPLRALLHSQPEPAVRFMVCGPYRWVRHPLYSFVIVLIWSTPNLSLDGLLFNVLWTCWICVGAYLEERDLLGEFGAFYREYRQRVPMLIPWRHPVTPIAVDVRQPSRSLDMSAQPS